MSLISAGSISLDSTFKQMSIPENITEYTLSCIFCKYDELAGINFVAKNAIL
jgi:hypothetical protein